MLSLASSRKTISDWHDGTYGRITTLSRRNQGFFGIGGWLNFLFLKILYIYIFLRSSLLDVFRLLFFFSEKKKSFFYAVLSTVKNKWRTFSEKAVVEKITIIFCPLITIEGACGCVWACVSECAHTSKCNMELLLATKEHFDCLFFLWYWKKKEKKKITLFHFGSSAPLAWLSPISYLVVINLCSSGTNILLFIYSCCSMWWWTDWAWAGNQKWNRVLLPVSSDTGPQYKTTLAGRKSGRAGTNGTFTKTSSLFVQPPRCSLFDVHHSWELPDPASCSSVRQAGTRFKKKKKKKKKKKQTKKTTTAGHQHCNFLTYNKAISYFLPYKWK